MNKRRGFTLIELLVVIAIIALLMSILMPALSKVRKQALSVVCRSRLKQWGVVFSMYTNDNDGMWHKRTMAAIEGYKRCWPHTYKKRYIEPKMRFCPTAENVTRTDGTYGTWHYAGNQYRPDYMDPALRMPGESEYNVESSSVEQGWFTGSYGMNRNVEDMQGSDSTSTGYFRKVDVKNADKVPVFADSQYLYFGPCLPNSEAPAFSGDYGGGFKIICIDRHMGSINVLFMDWSARKVGLKELWTLKHDRNYDTCGGHTVCGNGGGKAGKSACRQVFHDETLPPAYWMDKFPEY